jgi:hypothetical protein
VSIIIPRRMNEDTAFQCTLCPAEFYEDERHQYERHVLNHPTEDLVPHSPRLQAPALFGDAAGMRTGRRGWSGGARRTTERRLGDG